MMNGKHKHIDYTLKAYRPAPIQDVGIMAIRTGLSVTVAGHLIELERDERTKTARLVVTVISGHQVTGLENEAIRAAAQLLKERAERFLGDWKVEELPREYHANAANAG